MHDKEGEYLLYFDIPDYDRIFYDTIHPVILNDVPCSTKEDLEQFNALLMTTTNDEVLSSIPTCVCGKTKYTFNSGVICSSCGTEVTVPVERNITSRVWIKVPDGIHGFISPYLWGKLTSILSSRGLNILEWAIDPTVEVKPKNVTKPTLEKINYLTNLGWKRSLNHFVLNWEVFFKMIEETSSNKTRNGKKVDLTLELEILRSYSDVFFPKYLPMPTKAIMILENTNVGDYADVSTMSPAMNAARTIADICKPISPPMKPMKLEKLELKTVQVLKNLIEYARIAHKENLCSKEGWLRSHVCRAKGTNTARMVITSICRTHDYREIHLPWSESLVLFKVHLTSILMKRFGYTEKRAEKEIELSGRVFSPFLHGLLIDLIHSSSKMNQMIDDDIAFHRWKGRTDEQIQKLIKPRAGIVCLVQRNPTLGPSSIQRMYITWVKDDIHDKTASVSDVAAPGFNLDHDGDEMNISVLVLADLIQAADKLDISNSIHDTINLGELNNNIKLPDPAAETFGNFLNRRYFENLKPPEIVR